VDLLVSSFTSFHFFRQTKISHCSLICASIRRHSIRQRAVAWEMVRILAPHKSNFQEITNEDEILAGQNGRNEKSDAGTWDAHDGARGADANKQIPRQHDTLNTIKDEKNLLLPKIASLEASNEEFVLKLRKLESSSTKLQLDMSAVEIENQRLSAESKALLSDLELGASKILAQKRVIEDLLAGNQELNKEKDLLETELKIILATNRSRLSETSHIPTEFDSFLKANEDLYNTVERLDIQNRGFMTQIDRLRKGLFAAERTIEDLDTTLENVDEASRTLKATIFKHTKPLEAIGFPTPEWVPNHRTPTPIAELPAWSLMQERLEVLPQLLQSPPVRTSSDSVRSESSHNTAYSHFCVRELDKSPTQSTPDVLGAKTVKPFLSRPSHSPNETLMDATWRKEPNPGAAIASAELCISRNQYQQALVALDTHLSRTPPDCTSKSTVAQAANAMLLKACTLRVCGQYSHALSVAEEVVARMAERNLWELLAKAQMHRGLILMGLGEWADAEMCFLRAAPANLRWHSDQIGEWARQCVRMQEGLGRHERGKFLSAGFEIVPRTKGAEDLLVRASERVVERGNKRAKRRWFGDFLG
jgi:tetratricopeptide (TPR) repeat protein